MTTRRKFIQAAATLPLFMPMLGCQNRDKNEVSPDPSPPTNSGESQVNASWSMPEEADPHQRTWMAFGASKPLWGMELIKEVRKNLATIAQTIARFEPVTLLVREREIELAQGFFTNFENIEFVVQPLNDLWIRDYGAVYVVNSAGKKGAIDFNFNGWGEKQIFEDDALVAAKMAKHSNVELIETELCLEGGGIEVDGAGTAIITESCVLNANRNPDWSKKDCEDELYQLLGLEKIIWLPGVKGADITDSHTDFYARFCRPGVAVAHLDHDVSSPEYKLTREHLEILKSETDAQGNRLNVITIDAPATIRPEFDLPDFCAGYINFYVCNRAVIAPQFGDRKADGAAKEKLADAFPDREIVMLNIDGIAAGGGGIHCATQQEPKI